MVNNLAALGHYITFLESNKTGLFSNHAAFARCSFD